MSKRKLRTIFNLDLMVKVTGTTNNPVVHVWRKSQTRAGQSIDLTVNGVRVETTEVDLAGMKLISMDPWSASFIKTQTLERNIEDLIRREKLPVEEAVDTVIDELYVELRVLLDRLNIRPIEFEKEYHV